MTQPAAVTVVAVEVPQLEAPATNEPPATPTHGETAPATATVDLALTVGSLQTEVQQLRERIEETETTAEAAQQSAQLATDLALSAPTIEATPEPTEPEAEAVTLVEVPNPSSADADAPAKTPATARGFLHRMLFG